MFAILLILGLVVILLVILIWGSSTLYAYLVGGHPKKVEED